MISDMINALRCVAQIAIKKQKNPAGLVIRKTNLELRLNDSLPTTKKKQEMKIQCACGNTHQRRGFTFYLPHHSPHFKASLTSQPPPPPPCPPHSAPSISLPDIPPCLVRSSADAPAIMMNAVSGQRWEKLHRNRASGSDWNGSEFCGF